jgi:thiol-disulfide isomerase/thioredoxin
MKNFILILFTTFCFSQSDVPEKYWLNDDTFDEVVIGSAFDDNEGDTILVEFWAEFNAENCFAEWDQIKNAKYYRINIADSPKTKKQYRVRMAPTLIIFKNGSKQNVFKAGLDLLLPTDLKEVQETINEINNANKF